MADGPHTGGATKEKVESKQQEPDQYKVILLNDDYTKMDFVVRFPGAVFKEAPWNT